MAFYKLRWLHKHAPTTATRVYQDAIFDTKKKALPGVELPKRAKNKDFQQILGLLEVLFRYAIVWQVVTEVTGHAAY